MIFKEIAHFHSRKFNSLIAEFDDRETKNDLALPQNYSGKSKDLNCKTMNFCMTGLTKKTSLT